MSKLNKKSKIKATVATTVFAGAAATAAIIVPITASNKKTADKQEGGLDNLAKNLSNWISEDESLSIYEMNNDPEYLNNQLKNLIESFIINNKHSSYKFAKIEKISYDDTMNFFQPVLKVLVHDTFTNEKVDISINSLSWNDTAFNKVFISNKINNKLEIIGLTDDAKQMLKGEPIEIYIPNHVKINGQTLPVEVIGTSAFANLDNIKSVKFTNSKISKLKEIKDFAFKNMAKLTSLTVPASVSTIGFNPWLGSSLYKIDIDKANQRYTIQTTGTSSYLYDKTLNSIVAVTDAMITGNEFILNNPNVLLVSEYAFSNLLTLNIVNLLETAITKFAPHSFEVVDGATSTLTKVIAPQSLKSIGERAFYNVKTLNAFGPSDQLIGTLYLGDLVESVGLEAFNSEFVRLSILFRHRKEAAVWDGLSSLKTINPKLVIDIRDKDDAFQDGTLTELQTFSEVFTYQLENNGYTITGLNKNNKPIPNIQVPNFIFNPLDGTIQPVLSIKENAFKFDPNNVDKQLEAITSIKLGTELTAIGNAAFANLPNLSQFTFDKNKFTNITTIPTSLFEGCEQLDGNQVLDQWQNIEVVKENAFKNTKTSNIGLLAKTVQTIESSAFENTKITKLNLTNAINLKNILPNAFANNQEMTSITLPGSLVNLGAEAFINNPKLTSIDLEKTALQKIESNILKSTAVTNLTLPKTVTIVEQNGLANMPELTKLLLNEGLVTLNDGAISNNPKLPSLFMPETVKSVGTSVLSGDISLQEVWLSKEQFTSVVKDQLENNKEVITELRQLDKYDPKAGFNFNIVKEPTQLGEVGEVELISYKGNQTDVVLSSYITGFGNNKNAKYKVIGIGEKAFSPFVSEKNKNITSLSLPSTVTYINNNAFENLTNLTTINLDNITKLGVSVFINNTKLTNIGNFNNTLVEIPSNTFLGCESLTNVQLPSQLTTIGANAFSNTGLINIEIPNSVHTVFEAAFSNNANLFSAKIGTGINTLPKMMFYNNPKLELINDFNSSKVVNIGDSAFANTKIRSIDFPNTIVSIGNQSFSNTALETVSLPDSINKVGSNAFFPNTNLTKLMISIAQFNNPNVYNNVKFNSNIQFLCLVRTGFDANSDITTNGFTFEKINNTDVRLKSYTGTSTHITIPDVVQEVMNGVSYKVTEIAENAFLDKTSINKLTFNRYVTTVGNAAFKNTNIQTVEIPYAGVISSFGNEAFANTKLTNIDFLEKTSITTLSNELFASITTLNNVVIPQKITQWNERVFANTPIKTLNLGTNRNLNFSASAFENMSALVSVTLPTNLKTITQAMFKSCTSLQSINLPVLTKTIEAQAFANTKISQLTFPTTVTTISPDAFNDSQVKKVYYSITNVLNKGFLDQLNNALNKHNIASNAYDESSNPSQSAFGFVYEILNDSEIKITNYVGNDTNVFLPSLIKSYNDPNKIYKVKAIDANVFKQQANNISKISFDSGLELTSLPNGILSDMPKLEEVVLPRGLVNLSENMFANSSNLAKINIEDLVNLVEIKQNALMNTGLSSIDMGKNTKLRTIAQSAFENCVQLIEVIFPDSLATLGDSAFATTSLINLNLSSTQLTSIPAQTFINSYALEEVHLPIQLVSIGTKAFYNSPNIKKVNYDDQSGYNFKNLANLTTIKANAFLNNSKLTKIDLSQTKITELEQFVSKETVQYLKLPATITSGQRIGWFGVNIIEIDLSLCTKIDKEMLRFYNMQKLKKVILPANTTALVDSAFYDCVSLTTIENLGNITRIENNTFRNCQSLSSIPLNYAKITYVGAYGLSGTAVEKFDFITNRDSNLNLQFETSNGAQFFNSRYLTELLIPPKGMTIIPPYFLKDCIRLTFINPLEYVQEIKWEAFANCKSLNWYFFHKNISQISNTAFYNCDSLYSVVVHTNNGGQTYLNRIKNLVNASFNGSSNIHFSEYETSSKTPWFANNFNVVKTIARYNSVVIQEIQVKNIRVAGTWTNDECFFPPIYEYYENGKYYFNIITELGNSDSSSIYNPGDLTSYPNKLILPAGLKKLYYKAFAFGGALTQRLAKPIYIPSSLSLLHHQGSIFTNSGLSEFDSNKKVVFLGETLKNIDGSEIIPWVDRFSDRYLINVKRGTKIINPETLSGKIQNLGLPYSVYEQFKSGDNRFPSLTYVFKNNLRTVYFDDIRMFEDKSFRNAILDAFTDNVADRNKVQFLFSNSPWKFNGW